jgi:hypothetical protein
MLPISNPAALDAAVRVKLRTKEGIERETSGQEEKWRATE